MYYDQCQSSTTSTVVKAPLVRASLVKRRYIKYLAFFSAGVWLRTIETEISAAQWALVAREGL